ncbi:hypothetical protein CSTERLE_12090 [Thermoclostridium stercorarium subsp. leptospartum DSM 9219]|uniref:Uncharacterized protein n=1 Tax=Thermoclostridium stercorarium subsp. leptospartum DSM 9219 TaxID=1346611 RepID=A0A1B1YNC6_THEST|nr:hypothetical protein [Thermoclostridium stercorarium]ANX02258.1 hypothetical protein CSTERLE_12090 [Thermoclostridium stercorarium subsp. leptospartum DSM 9219]
MAYALVVASEKEETEKGFSPFSKIKDMITAFLPARIHVSFREIDENLLLYIITMPLPEMFFLKNRRGRKRTLKKWAAVVKNNNIEHYLLEQPLKEYLNREWTMKPNGYLDESIRRNVHLLFSMEPLKGLEMRNMTITLSGIEKGFINPKLLNVLGNFKMVNVTASYNEMDGIWDEFMAETGVPVCITEEFGVLSRSDVWISYEEKEVDYPFDGIKVALSSKKITGCGLDKRYRIGYSLQRKLLKRIGAAVVQKFNPQILAEFLMFMVINRKEITISEAEELLGVKISIFPDEIQKYAFLT